MKYLPLAILLLFPLSAAAQDSEGLEAWDRIYQVTAHPRCANCHVGPDNIPVWSGPSLGAPRPHGMNITAGDSRIGAETLPCAACHVSSTQPNDTPHAPPHIDGFWQLAPVEFEWFGKSTKEVCNQLRDPDRNGGRSFVELADHLKHDAFVAWGFNPGGKRQPAPFTLRDHVNDVLAWGVAGQPCPGD
ncbi:hypothetical protein [uncultured Roseovarius sp.]|uniref:hypothetical protein n=1 Tax=uncultured Roseovarius sp. TaxID=293344 RepID=UPI00262D49BC|nr:hypothetical protein [uncultured Roseovarius sp.]